MDIDDKYVENQTGRGAAVVVFEIRKTGYKNLSVQKTQTGKKRKSTECLIGEKIWGHTQG
jgi:hypothetical protein